MTDIVSPLLEGLNAHPELGGLVTFLISAGESVAILGTIVPGSIMMTGIGALAGAGILPLWQTILWAILGAIVGDGISYWIGHHFQNRLHRVWPFRSHPMLLKTGEVFFRKHGSMSVFIGRFVGPVRALVPLVAGMLGMKPLRFIVANVASAIGWAPAYMLPGILLGAASLELPPDIAVHVIMTLLFILLFISLCLWFTYKLFQQIQNQTNQIQNWMWRWMKKSPYLSFSTVILKHHNANKSHGQLNLALYFGLISLLFFGLAIYVKLTGSANIMVNDAVFHFFRGIRNDTMDNAMIMISLLGQKQVVLPVVVVLFAWLIVYKRWRAACHALALGVIAALCVFMFKHLIQSPRPWGTFHNPETFSMPSGHTTLATSVYLGLAFLIASSFQPRRRWLIYTPAVLIAVIVGISRLYLGAHWFTDVISGWLLSAAVLIIVIISYHRVSEKNINPVGLFIVSFSTLAITFSLYYSQNITLIKTDTAQINWPSAEFTMGTWWQKNDAMPAYRASLFGFPSEQINIEWVGTIAQITETLMKEGWNRPPERDFVSTLHRITDISSTEYLPLVSPQYLDKNPVLTLTRIVNTKKDQRGLLVIRLWDTNRTISENHLPVWVGIINAVPRSYSWIYNKHVEDLNISPSYVFPKNTSIGEWEWKILTMNLTMNNDVINQKIMLIRQNKLTHKRK